MFLHFSFKFLLILFVIIPKTLYFRAMQENKKDKKNISRLVFIDPLGLYRDKLKKIRDELKDGESDIVLKDSERLPLLNEKNYLGPTIKLSIDLLYKTLFNE